METDYVIFTDNIIKTSGNISLWNRRDRFESPHSVDRLALTIYYPTFDILKPYHGNIEVSLQS